MNNEFRAKISSERRKEIGRNAANSRWHPELCEQHESTWAERNHETIRESQRLADEKRKDDAERKKYLAEHQRRLRIRWRLAVIEKYGGCCAFCGSTQYEHLTIDHIGGWGKQHRKSLPPRSNIYKILFQSEYRPDLYRLLCWNCHMAMTRYGVEPGGEELHDVEYWHERGAVLPHWKNR